MEITLGHQQQYNVGEKPTVILYTYINRHAGTGTRNRENDVHHHTWCNNIASIFRLYYAFIQAGALRSIGLRYGDAPIVTRVFFSFLFVHLEMSFFPSIFCTIFAFSLYGEYVVRSFLPNGVFLPCEHGLDF